MAAISEQNLSPQDAKESFDLKTALFVDVREPLEYAGGRIPSARLVPLGTLKEAAQAWRRGQKVIVYCRSGKRSEKALSTLAELGFTDIAHLEGGYLAWAAEQLPTEKSEWAPWSLERQVRFAVGILVASFTLLGLLVHPGFLGLNFLLAGGLIFSAVTDTCGLALVLAKLPWNRVQAP